jgi:predicted nucleotidyltransferase
VITTVRKKTSFLRERTKAEFIAELKTHLNSHVLEAYVFGSFWTNEFNADSDLDILIVANTHLEFHERYKLFPELSEFFKQDKVDFDLIIYTPEEFQKLTNEGKNSSVGFWSSFSKTSKKI